MPLLTQSKTNWKYILILLVLAVLVGGGILVYLNYFEKEITILSQFPEVQIKEIERSAKRSDKDFISYEKKSIKDGAIIGYKINYPSNWIVKEDIEWIEGITTVFVPSIEKDIENPLHNFIVFVGRPEAKRTLDELKDFVIKDSCDRLLEIEDTTISSLPAYKLKCIIDSINSNTPPLILEGPLVSIEIVTLKSIKSFGKEKIVPARIAFITPINDYLKYIDEINIIFNSFEIL